MAQPRPDRGWGGPRGEASSAYADDTHSGGWAVACIVKSLRRIALARDRATLHADPTKCKVLTSERFRPDLDALLGPLRSGAGHWEVVTRMRVLGVTLSDPTDRASLERAIRETLRVRVVDTTDRLIAELEAGAKPATAYFAFTRFVVPNALYHMQVWGLFCAPDAWTEVDDAFTRFAAALCPLDLRARISTASSLRAELSLPQEHGGLGIPRVAREARLRAADQWDHRDAVEAGALRENVVAAYDRSDALDRSRWLPLGMEPHYKAVAESLSAGLAAADARDLAWRRKRNVLRSALWGFNATPWVAELTVDRVEWDVMWRLTFGGMSAEMQRRLDRADEGCHAWRGRRMEHAVTDAIRENVPQGALSAFQQPSPERYPADHAARCLRDGSSPDGWKRADIALAFATTGKIITLDVRTTNTHCASARHASSPEVFLQNQEKAKTAKYADYYRSFRPYVIDLTGAVTERSYGVLKEITKEAAAAGGPRLFWERFDWAARIQRQIAVAMVRATAWLATRASPSSSPVAGNDSGGGRAP